VLELASLQAKLVSDPQFASDFVASTASVRVCADQFAYLVRTYSLTCPPVPTSNKCSRKLTCDMIVFPIQTNLESSLTIHDVMNAIEILLKQPPPPYLQRLGRLSSLI